MAVPGIFVLNVGADAFWEEKLKVC